MDISGLDDDDIISEINLTPLVDVSLVLVIIFMVVAPFITHILKPLMLPDSAKAGLTEQNTIKVSVFPDGTLAVGSALVDQGNLAAIVHVQLSVGEPKGVLVRAGANVTHGRVMEIVKIVQEAGAQRVAFA